MSSFEITDAARRDAADIAILENIASHGLAGWIWQGAVNRGQAEDAFDYGRARMGNPENVFGIASARIATCEEQVAGCAISYQMPPASKEDDPFADDPVFSPLLRLFDKSADLWFIDTLATYKAYRGQGIGKALLRDAMKLGQSSDHSMAALVAEDGNFDALRLYESFGFSVADSEPYVAFSKHSHSKNWLLMTAPLNRT